MTYQVFALTSDEKVLELIILQAKLRSQYQQDKNAPHDIKLIADKKLIIKWSDFEFTVYPNSEAYVLEESQEIARSFPEYPEIKQCDRRLEVTSSVEDLEMEYFNDYVLIMQSIEGLAKVFLYEPQTGQMP